MRKRDDSLAPVVTADDTPQGSTTGRPQRSEEEDDTMPKPAKTPSDGGARSDHELDRLLAGGRPAGPELDQVWDRIAPRVIARPSWQEVWMRRAWAVLVPAAVATAALVAVVVQGGESSLAPARDPGLTPRGQLRPTEPVEVESSAAALEASCGAADHPCVVGEPIGLRMRGSAELDVGYIVLDTVDGPQLIAGPLILGDKAVDVLVLVRPEPGDVKTGVRLRAIRLAEPLTPEAVLASPSTSLHLAVQERKL